MLMILCVCMSLFSYSQKKSKNQADNCGNFISQVSYFWKLDSLGSNGYRLKVYNGFVNCKFPTLTYNEMINKLGKPNFTRNLASASYFCYYYYDGRIIPKDAGYTSDVGYLSFRFDNDKNFLAGVSLEHLE